MYSTTRAKANVPAQEVEPSLAKSGTLTELLVKVQAHLKSNDTTAARMC